MVCDRNSYIGGTTRNSRVPVGVPVLERVCEALGVPVRVGVRVPVGVGVADSDTLEEGETVEEADAVGDAVELLEAVLEAVSEPEAVAVPVCEDEGELVSDEVGVMVAVCACRDRRTRVKRAVVR